MFTPICIPEHNKVLPPCRSVCEEAWRGCQSIIKQYHISWPSSLDCKRFPDARDPNLCMDYKETTGTTAVTVTTNSQSATGTSKKIVELYTLFVFLTKMNLASPYFSVFKLSAQLKQHWTYGKFGAMLLPEILAAPKPCIHGIFYNSPQMFTRTLWYK